MNSYVGKLREALESYRAEWAALEQNRKPLDGIFGTGSTVKSNACHDRFDSRVEETMRQMETDGAAGEEIGAAVAFVLSMAAPTAEMNSLDLFLVAVQRHCIPLIALLPGSQAAALAQRYEKTWPRRTRLPVQTELLKALKAQAKK